MACISDDGTLNPITRQVLHALRSPGAEEDIAGLTGLPLYRVRSNLRELAGAGLLVKTGDRYLITESGLNRLEE